jgi:aromatic ring hydroxylase
VLLESKEQGLIPEVAPYVEKLVQGRMRVSADIRHRLLRLAGEIAYPLARTNALRWRFGTRLNFLISRLYLEARSVSFIGEESKQGGISDPGVRVVG